MVGSVGKYLGAQLVWLGTILMFEALVDTHSSSESIYHNIHFAQTRIPLNKILWWRALSICQKLLWAIYF